MKAICAFLTLALVSTASAYFSVGNHDPEVSFLLFARAVLVEFGGANSKYVVQFNPCLNLDIIIDQVELMQFRGKEMTVQTIRGGQGSHMVGLELTEGDGIANFEVKVWGQWQGRPKDVNHEVFYRIGSKWKDCSVKKS